MTYLCIPKYNISYRMENIFLGSSFVFRTLIELTFSISTLKCSSLDSLNLIIGSIKMVSTVPYLYM